MIQGEGMQVEEIAYREDSARLFAQIAAEEGAAFLDSGMAPGPRRQRDVLLREPYAWIWEDADGVWRQARGAQAQRQGESLFAVLRAEMRKTRASTTVAGVDLPLLCGFLRYDAGVAAVLGRKPAGSQPLAVFAAYDQALVQDHRQQRAWILGSLAARKSWQERLTAPVPRPEFQLCAPGVLARWQYAEYAAAFAQVQEYLHAGDCYQINLAQSFHARWRGDPWPLHQRLRARSRAPFSGYFRHPWGTLLSVSPERLLRLHGGQLEARPIKGTRARLPDPQEDRRVAEELCTSGKDRAENLMIVDLLRNDLGRVAEVGSVQVPELFALESYDQVHHLVSSVRARLAPDYDAWDALAAAFPGGSITGAPKRRAMEIIAELEAEARGIYCGSFGYVTAAGDMDWNILIRSIELQQNGSLQYFGGGAIVIDSDCAAEYAESLSKVEMITETLAEFLPPSAACATVAR